MQKMAKLHRFIKNSAVFFVGNVLSRIVSFLLLPLYTSVITTSGMGQFDISATVSTMLLSICYFELWAAVLRFIYDGNCQEEKNNVICAGFQIFLLSTCAFVPVAMITYSIFEYPYKGLIIAYGVANALTNFVTYVARGLNKSWDFSISGVINTLVHLATNILLLVLCKLDYYVLYISYIVGVAAQVGYLSYRTDIWRVIASAKPSRMLLKGMVRYALPLCLHTIAYWLLHSSNRLIYNVMYGNEASGVFSVGARFGSIITLATTCFTYAWQDLAFSAETENALEAKTLFLKACEKYMLFLSASMVLLLPIIKLIFPYLVKGNYTVAITLVPSFILVAIISSFSAFMENVFLALKDTKTLTLSTGIAALVNMALSYPMIKIFGATGVNIAIITAYFINIAVRTYALNKKIGFYLNIRHVIMIAIWFVLTIGGYIVGTALMQIVIFTVNMALAILLFWGDLRKVGN